MGIIGKRLKIVGTLILGELLLLWLMGTTQNYLGAYVVGILVIAGLIGFSVWWSIVLTAHTHPKKRGSQVHAARTFTPGPRGQEELGWNSYFHKHNLLRDVLCILYKRPL
jgi:hypothetical protein